MDAIVRVEQRFLPALAEKLAEWFPELNGRAFAASDITVAKDKDSVPTLPLAMLGLIQSEANPSTMQPSSMFNITDVFGIQFWLEPTRFKRHNGTETPFWSYYPYDAIRHKLLSELSQWEAPNGRIVAYRRLTVSADPFAVVLSFHFTATFRWCSDLKEEGDPFSIGFLLRSPESCVIEDECPPCDPCP